MHEKGKIPKKIVIDDTFFAVLAPDLGLDAIFETETPGCPAEDHTPT